MREKINDGYTVACNLCALLHFFSLLVKYVKIAHCVLVTYCMYEEKQKINSGCFYTIIYSKIVIYFSFERYLFALAGTHACVPF